MENELATQNDPKKRRGRPVERIIKLKATPERVAKALFSAVKPPDPSKRVTKTG